MQPPDSLSTPQRRFRSDSHFCCTFEPVTCLVAARFFSPAEEANSAPLNILGGFGGGALRGGRKEGKGKGEKKETKERDRLDGRKYLRNRFLVAALIERKDCNEEMRLVVYY